MADAATKPPPPLLFQRTSIHTPKTIPPPLPPTALHKPHQSTQPPTAPSHHSRHSSTSATTLATLAEDRDEDAMGLVGAGAGCGGEGEGVVVVRQGGVGVIEEHGEDEEKECLEEDEEDGVDAGMEDEAEEDVDDAAREEKEGQSDGEEVEEEEDEEGEFEEGDEEEQDDSGDQSEPDVLRIRGDSHASMSTSSRSGHSIPQSPVSRAFAIFGREIRHVSPNSSFSSDTLPLPFGPPTSQKRTPRTVPPPLPPVLLSPTSPTVAASLSSGKLPVVSLTVPRSPQALDVPSPLTPLQPPLSPATPTSPMGIVGIIPADLVSPVASAHSSPTFFSQLSPPPPPPLPMPEVPHFSRSASQNSSTTSTTSSSAAATPVHARSAANSLTVASSTARQPDAINKVRATAPPGFQFPTGKLNARAAPAADAASTTADAGNAMSASTPLLSQGNAAAASPLATPSIAGFTPSFTAPSAFSSPAPSARTSTTSAPSSPRRLPSSTVSAPPLHSLLAAAVPDGGETGLVQRPATAGEASRPEGRRRGVAAAVVAEISHVVTLDSQPQHGKHKCSKCVSFSVRGSYCLKHLYHAGLVALAAPNTVSSTLPPLSQTLSASSRSYQDKMLRIADELLKTEKTYYEALRVAYRSFQLRLEVAAQLAANPSELSGVNGGGGGSDKGSGGRRDPVAYLPVLSAEEIGTIFSKLNDIFTLSSNLYHDLNTLNTIRIQTHLPHRASTLGAASDASAPASASSHLTLLLPFLGSTLLHYSSYFRVYQSYLENYDDAIKTLVQLRRERDVLDVWLTWTEKCEGVSIDSLLIQPVQRLPRYLLLLQEIIKAEDQRRASDAVDPNSGLFTHYPLGYTDILTAREKISRIADAINSSLHDKETAAVVAHLQSLFEHDSSFVPFATPTRTLVKQGTLKKINETRRNAVFGASSSYRFFLFNDLLLYAEEAKKIGGTVRYRLKNTMPLMDLAVVEDGGADRPGTLGGKTDRCWALRNEATGKLLTLSCKSDRERSEWCEAIRAMQRKLRELSESMHVNTFDGVTRQEKKANLSKAKLMMGIGG